MSENPPTDDELLPLSAVRRIDEICDRFEAAWKAGTSPRIAPYLEGLGSKRFPARDRAAPILYEIVPAAPEIRATLLNGLQQHLRICERIVRRSEHVEDLARREVDDLLVMVGNTAQIGRRHVPPLLLQQETL